MNNTRTRYPLGRFFTTRLGVMTVLALITAGCATTKDLNTLRAQLSEEVAAVRNEAVQSRQSVEALKTDVTLLQSLGVAVDTMKRRLDGLQATVQGLQTEAESHRTALTRPRADFRDVKVAHEGVARETDRRRMSVGSIEQGMIH